MADAVVTEKTFDEFHLYTLGNPVTLRDKETKQVEFVRATGVKAERIYVYEEGGFSRRGQRATGKVQVFREFKNSEAKDRKSTRLNSSHVSETRRPSSA